MKKTIIFIITALTVLTLTACSNKTSDENTLNTSAAEATQSETSAVQPEETAPAETSAVAVTSPATPDHNFIPILTAEDIEYKGKPYKDLTAEEFIQLWAQSEREYNVQRLYHIYYANYGCDKMSGDPEERAEEDIKEYMEQLLRLELTEGRMPLIYYDVELHELEDAPEGYYDVKENEKQTDELNYMITYKSKICENGVISYEAEDMRWITMKKTDGYWKIGLRFASSPYRFTGNVGRTETAAVI